VFTFAQMISLAMMGAFIGNVPGSGDVGFALAYALNSIILAIMWFRTGWHDPEHRSGAYPYSVAFAVGAAIFVASAFVDAPAVYWMWAIAVVIQAAAAVPAARILRQEFGEVLATPSLIERFGLIVIIVLGEVVAGAINGMASRDPTSLQVVAVGVLGVLLAIALWWLYFDLVSERMHLHGKGLWWMYIHVPLIIGIAGAGAAVLAAVERVGEPASNEVRWLLVGTVALVLVCLAGLTRSVDALPGGDRAGRAAEGSLVGAALVILALGLTSSTAGWSIAWILLVLLVPIVFSVGVWRSTLES